MINKNVIVKCKNINWNYDKNYLFELESGHAVEEFGEMLGDGGRVVSVGQDVEQIGRRHEVEPREGQTFRLQVLSERLLTQG